ncbi:hypothetical protein Tco_1086880 [Tanacetum coccineum]
MVPKENRLDIGKCNGRIPRGLKPKEETFQVVLDALALTPCYPAFIVTTDVPRNLGHTGVINSLNDVVIDQMHQLRRTFAAIINRSLSGKTSGLDKLRLSRAQILWGMYHQKYVDYVELLWEDFTYQIDNKVYKKQEKIKEASQIYGAVLPECLTSPEMKESKAYKTYLGHAIDEEPVTKANELRDQSRSLQLSQQQVSSSESLWWKQSLKERKKEKVDVARGKGIELLSEESESESWGNDEDDNNNEQESSNEGSEQENVSEEQESDSEQDNESKDDEIESEGADVKMNEAQQGNENLDTTQEQVVDDAHVTVATVTKKTEVLVTSFSRSYLASKFLIFSNIPQTDAYIVSLLDVHVHHEVPRTQAPTLLTIPVSVITESSPVYTNIPQSSQTFTSTPILTTPTPPPIIETTNPLSIYPDFALVFRFNDRITTLEKEVVEIKKDPLHTQGFAAVLAVLITGTSQSRQHGMSEPVSYYLTD